MSRILISTILMLPALALCEVADKSPAGFQTKSTATINASPEQVYLVLTQGVGQWWDSEHTWSGSAKNLTIEAKPGGCFCEKLPAGGGVQHMTVIYAAPGQKLRMSGGLGPLQEAGLTGVLTFDLAKSGEATLVTMTYSVGGYFPGGLDKLAAPVDGVISSQLTRLKAYVDKLSNKSPFKPIEGK